MEDEFGGKMEELVRTMPTNSLKTSLIEMQQIRQGKLKKRSWEELKTKLNLITQKAKPLPVKKCGWDWW
jgi:hypothetical protein